MVKPTSEQMEKYLPEAMDHMPKTFAGGGTSMWAMDGMAIREDGWYQMSKDEKVNYVSHVVWNPRRRCFEGQYTDNWGNHGTSTMKMCDDGDSFTMTARETDVDGVTTKSRGTMRFIDNDTMEWSYSMLGPFGIEMMQLEGTSYRKK
jgi:hypothetical protein